ncbi:PREDICTED: spermidine hydroxycinnamoyl transferase-like [Ipomoea nil]|uniref:spermidine hydroxycinnamoyl transferase-like n=1 Tax=Ipomoea nil TaxID=35883 RepID=UPI000900A225|nr:PREDICTED: spermidine hydroxycinnamoyl transferase-like [Ipomoea nil]XP_019188752.1 PREDICTED: spermidine hydroxycinnamoyl transferase-like [Ipomoea nil]XP_019188753.1 PREDICTED: spermidine hydroxycinnamoyl transferase-like [Ipomoea nil]
MKVNVKRSYVVKPSEPTWSGLLSLSELDQIATMMHVETLYFYSTPSTLSPDAIIDTLRLSLSQVLVHFYPLAGRLSWTSAGGSSALVLNCNAAGVVLVEAESDAVLADLGDFSPCPELNHLVPSVDYSGDPIQDIPLFVGQLTKFRCGGISLGFAISHVVADGHGLCHFLSEWANLASGKPLSSAPFHDRRRLLRGVGESSSPQGGPRRVFDHSPPLIVGQSSDESERMKETKVSTLRLSKPQIHALKAAANNGRSYNAKPRDYTRYEVITAHIWRCACKARSHKPQQPTNLCFSVDIRRRMEPPLPDSYFGNAVVDVVIHGGVSGEIISGPLQDVASKIREAIDGVTSEYVNSSIDFYRNEVDVIKRQELLGVLFGGNPNLSVISWVGLPIQGLDFGWGEEIHMSPGNHDCDGDVLILPGPNGIDGDDGSLLVAACLQVDHIQDFNKYFYQDINNL